jgi:hypothetical protein
MLLSELIKDLQALIKECGDVVIVHDDSEDTPREPLLIVCNIDLVSGEKLDMPIVRIRGNV